MSFCGCGDASWLLLLVTQSVIRRTAFIRNGESLLEMWMNNAGFDHGQHWPEPYGSFHAAHISPIFLLVRILVG